MSHASGVIARWLGMGCFSLLFSLISLAQSAAIACLGAAMGTIDQILGRTSSDGLGPTGYGVWKSMPSAIHWLLSSSVRLVTPSVTRIGSTPKKRARRRF